MPPLWLHSIALFIEGREMGLASTLVRTYNGFATVLKRRRSVPIAKAEA